MEGTHEVGSRPFMPASTLSGRSVALLRVNLGDYTSESQSIYHGNCTRICFVAVYRDRAPPVAPDHKPSPPAAASSIRPAVLCSGCHRADEPLAQISAECTL